MFIYGNTALLVRDRCDIGEISKNNVLAVDAWATDPAQAEFARYYPSASYGRKVDAACIFPIVIPMTSIIRIFMNYTPSDRVNVVWWGMDKEFPEPIGMAPTK